MPDNTPETAAPVILLTRPREASARFAAACTARFGAGLRPVIAPLMQIVPRDPLPDLGGVTGLIFTAEPAVRRFATLSTRRDLPAFCVGDRTARAASEIGLDARSAAGSAEDLLALILRSVPGDGRLCHLHGAHTAGNLVGRLRAAGIAAEGVALYDQVARPPDAAFRAVLEGPTPAIVPLFSPRSAALFAAAAGPRPTHIGALAISENARAALPPDWHAACITAAAPTAEALLQALGDLI